MKPPRYYCAFSSALLRQKVSKGGARRRRWNILSVNDLQKKRADISMQDAFGCRLGERVLTALVDNTTGAQRAAMRKSLKIAFDVLSIAVPLIATTYFLARPDAFNAFLDWMMKTLQPAGSGHSA